MDYNLEYSYLNDNEHILKEISFLELLNKIDSFDSGVFYIGGAWCKNCQAIINLLNEECKNKFISIIYNYDPRYINELGEVIDIRDCSTLDDKLNYYNLVEKIGFNNTSLEKVKETLISRMHIPFIFALKNGICVDSFCYELIYIDGIYIEEGKNEDCKEKFLNRLDLLINKMI